VYDYSASQAESMGRAFICQKYHLMLDKPYDVSLYVKSAAKQERV
jgi:hypothetical protein